MIKTEKEIYLGDIIINFDKLKVKSKRKLFKEQFNKNMDPWFIAFIWI